MKTLGFLDTETSALSAEEGGRLLEVGLVLWSVEHRSTIRARSWLIEGPAENAAIAVNGIPPALLARGVPLADIEKQLYAIAVKEIDAFVCYNVDFDRKWFGGAVQNCRPWLCAQDDFAWPRSTGGKLVEVALAHGVGVSHAHRALTDCETMARLFERVAEQPFLPLSNKVPGELRRGSFEEWLADAARPRALFEVVSPNDNKDRASECGFRWVKGPDGKKWLGMRKRLAIEDAKKMPFEVRRVA